MIRLEGIAGLIDKVIRSRCLKALALNRLRFFAYPTAIFRFKEFFRICLREDPTELLSDLVSNTYNIV